MITQTIALFVDAYRELNAKKLFWITMLLSGLVVLVYAAIGIDEEGIKFLWFKLAFIPVTSEELPPELLYKQMFVDLGLGMWLAWIAAILALVSTAGIIPEMISGGSIEMLLSKPISRTRLFLTKYATGLLFVALQVGVFTVACMLVIGIRGGAWEPRLLLAIPLVVSFFSFLYGVCALIGVVTKSTIASLLLTLLFWCALFLVNLTDSILLMVKAQATVQRDALTVTIENVRTFTGRQIIASKREQGEAVPEDYQPTDEEIAAVKPWFNDRVEQRDRFESQLESLAPWVKGVYYGKSALPKTGETVELMRRWMISKEDLDRIASLGSDGGTTIDQESGDVNLSDADLTREVQGEFYKRSPLWVLGTSFLFEGFVLGVATVIFVRRDN